MDVDLDPVLTAAQQAVREVFPGKPSAGLITKAVVICEAITEDGERSIGWVNSRELSQWDAEGLVRFYLRNGLAEQTAQEVADHLGKGE